MNTNGVHFSGMVPSMFGFPEIRSGVTVSLGSQSIGRVTRRLTHTAVVNPENGDEFVAPVTMLQVVVTEANAEEVL